MKSLLQTLLYFLLITQISLAQSPDTTWTKIFATPGDDYGEYVEQTDDGGFIIVGSTDSSGSDDVLLIKTNSAGDTIWTKIYGTYRWDYASCVHQTSDGGYIIFGDTDSFYPTRWNGWLIKTNSNGDTLWTKVFTGPKYYFIRSGLELASGNGYVFTGYSKTSAAGNEDIWFARTNMNGDTVWTKTFAGSGREFSFSIAHASNGDLLIAGTTESFGAGESDALIIRVEGDGDFVWTKTYGGLEKECFYDIKPTDDGCFIAVGYTESFANNDYSAWLVKIDANGDTLWTKTFGDNFDERAYSVLQTSDGGFVFTGLQHKSVWDDDLWIVKTDENGNFLWSKNYGGEHWELGQSINQNNDGSLIITGNYYSEVTNTRDIWLLNFDPTFTDVERDDEAQIPETIMLKQNYPNPFNPTTTIEFGIPESNFVTLTIYNMLGEQLEVLVNETLSAGSYKANWNAEELTSGIYVYKLLAGNYLESKKMILLK